MNGEVRNNKFSKYPEIIDKFFLEKEVVIRIIPQELLPDLEKRFKNRKIKSANEYVEFLNSEIEFWKEKDPKDSLSSITKITTLKRAKQLFDNAIEYSSKNESQCLINLRDSVNQITSGIVFSKTSLASFLINNIGKDANFYRGLRLGLSCNKSSSISNTVADLEGFNAALAFRKVSSEMYRTASNELASFEENILFATEQYKNLNESYTSSFHEHEKMIDNLKTQTDEHISKMNEEAQAYYAEKEKRCAELEKLYSEKLKLQAPAEYWSQMETDYNNSGKKWMKASVLLAIAIVAGLIFALCKMPILFAEDTHWIDVFKSSAIITVIASIAVYILRLCVKMATSSFHLSRDAKERNKLTYFYLSLIEKNAVTDKERAIILNSLFSRSDTGLLKGDSTPVMTNNVTGLIDSLEK